MKFKKSIVILMILLLFLTIFNLNSVALNLEYIENNSSDFDGYIIKFKGESVYNFINNLKSSVKNQLLNFSVNINNSFFLKKIKDYKEKLCLKHIKIKNEIITSINYKENSNTLFKREYYNLFNGISIKKISSKLLTKIRNLPGIEKIYPDYKIYASLDKSVPLINADEVWKVKDDYDKLITGEGITIAILDTGVDYTHNDLKDNYLSEGSYDFINNDTDPMDDNGHGTHVTGIAVGKGIESKNRYIGVAPNAKFYSFKILNQNGEGNFSTYYDAMMRTLDPNDDGDFSDKVDIVSLSFGTKEPGNPDDNLCEILDNIVDAGITVVAAAGNLGPNLKTITSPGCARKSICVGSTDKNDIIASTSSRGPVELNGYILDKPDIVAPGVNIKSTSKSGDYEIYSGTSMATPHVSGAAALLLQAYPQLDPTEVKQKLIESTKDLGYERNIQGYGRIDIIKPIKPNKQLQIISPEIVTEAQIFKIQILDNNDKPIKVWTLSLIPFHIPRIKYGHSRRYIAPLIIGKNKESVKGTIFAFKFHNGFQIVKKDIIIVNKIRVNN
jgi:serine protease AprX